MPDDKPKRGFARLNPKQRREIAAKGGRSVPPELRGFSQHRDIAIEAGRKGGRNVDPKARSFSKNRQLAIEAGRKGGLHSRKSDELT